MLHDEEQSGRERDIYGKNMQKSKLSVIAMPFTLFLTLAPGFLDRSRNCFSCLEAERI